VRPTSFLSRFLVSAENRIHERGFHVALCGSGNDPAREARLLEELMGKNIDGLIVYSIGAEQNREVITRFVQHNGEVCILVNNYVPGLRTNVVLVDNRLGGYLVTEHLLLVGHRKIAYITENPEFTTNRDRMRGYRQALEEFGIAHVPEYVRSVARNELQPALLSLFSLQDPPTALFCSNDALAIRTMGMLGGMGKRIPDDVAVVGFDDREEAGQQEVPLTTVRQPAVELGYAAVDLLVDLVTGKQRGIRDIILEPELIVRRSCGSGRRKQANETR